jgi:hypothetical protein
MSIGQTRSIHANWSTLRLAFIHEKIFSSTVILPPQHEVCFPKSVGREINNTAEMMKPALLYSTSIQYCTVVRADRVRVFVCHNTIGTSKSYSDQLVK